MRNLRAPLPKPVAAATEKGPKFSEPYSFFPASFFAFFRAKKTSKCPLCASLRSIAMPFLRMLAVKSILGAEGLKNALCKTRSEANCPQL